MKKISLFIFSIIAIVASFLISSNVFAFENGEYIGADYREKDLHTHEDAVMFGSGKYKNYYMYYHYTKYNGDSYYIYCIDPSRKSGGTNAAFIVRNVLDQNDPVDAVILYIMSYSNYSYSERTMALRAFTPFTDYFSSNQPGNDDSAISVLISNSNSGLKWASEDPNKSIMSILGLENNDIESLIKVANLYEKYDPNKILSEKNSYVRGAKELFLKALKYGADIANGKIIIQKKVNYTTPEFNKEKYDIVTENGIRKAVREIRFTATFKGFNDESTDPVNIVITSDTNGVAVGTVYEYQVAGTDTWTVFDANTDFKSLLNKDSVTINFRIGVKAAVQEKAKFNIKFKVDTKYVDEDILTGAFIINKNLNNSQRFFIHDEEPGKHEPFTANIEWEDWVGYCTNAVPNKNDVTEYKAYMNECCRGHNEAHFNIVDECNKAKEANDEKSIKTYCTLKEEYCDLCNTKKEVPETCSEFSEGEFEKGKTAKLTGPEDIKVCVMDGEDDANQSYKLTKGVNVNGNPDYSFANNKYCKVSCKEDYAFDLPTGRYVISGRYFTLSMGVQAVKTCYTDMIDYAAFEKDLNDYGSKLNGYIAAGTATTLNTEFMNVYKEYKNAITDIQACSLGWDNSYTKSPEISFDYDEEYIEKLLGGNELKFVIQDDKKVTETKWFCNGSDVDRKYNNCIGANPTTEAQTKTLDVIECGSTNGNTYSCKTVSKQLPTTRYAKVATKFEATYAPESIFYTKYSTGVIEVNKDGNNKYTKLDSYLDSKIDESIKIRTGALPVSLKDKKGVYNYNIKFSNVGEYFDKNEYGRLVGGKNSVSLVNKDTKFKGTYVCSYIVNCPECKVECKDDPKLGIFCELDNPDPEPSECVGTCAFDSSLGELYSVHQTSLTNFNPTGRELGANLTTQKGEALIQSITDAGETIYNEPEYSFTFTPAAISFLRNEVNANSDNGYLGEPKDYDMNCSLYSDLVNKPEIKGTDKDYTICQSSVLDALANMEGVKAHPLQDSRSKISSWLDSEYCTDKGNVCALVGAIGPAWK